MAENMMKAKVTIKGTRPMLWHKFGPESLPLGKRERNGVAGNDPSEWERTHLATKSGQLYVEPTYVFACARDGGKYTRKGRSSLMPLVVATMQVAEDVVLIDRRMPKKITTDPSKDVYVDVRGVNNPGSRGRNIRYRVAASAGWKTSFHIIWDKTVISRGEMQAVLIDAGKLCGLGDGRSIGFGRFDVEEFEVVEDAQEKAAA